MRLYFRTNLPMAVLTNSQSQNHGRISNIICRWFLCPAYPLTGAQHCCLDLFSSHVRQDSSLHAQFGLAPYSISSTSNLTALTVFMHTKSSKFSAAPLLVIIIPALTFYKSLSAPSRPWTFRVGDIKVEQTQYQTPPVLTLNATLEFYQLNEFGRQFLGHFWLANTLLIRRRPWRGSIV